MKWLVTAEDLRDEDRPRVGGKAFALVRLARAGFCVPRTICVTTDAYHEYVDRVGLRERILLELHRKDFADMRWEEVWDCATRIRNLFLQKPMPPALKADLSQAIQSLFAGRAVAVRSSAPDEDAAGSSFAGLHESFVNVTGTTDILEHVQKVWASLWSDAALLYRQEIGLDVETSAMAVVIQEAVLGERSGVAFTRNPNDVDQGVVESVHGLNQGLVDGAVEPDRWILDRRGRAVVSHKAVVRKRWMRPSDSGVRLADLPADIAEQPPLSDAEALDVFDTALELEQLLQHPQDMEWTYRQDQIVVLQSRPITTLAADNPQDKRGWYLSLHRSFENLKQLRQRIEIEIIPGMIAAAEELAQQDLPRLSDAALADEIKRRWDINQAWVDLYWQDCIPFAHGVRLFGQFYNDVMRPQDPYEFVDLLVQTDMASLERNRMLEEMASLVRSHQGLSDRLKQEDFSEPGRLLSGKIDQFTEKFGYLADSQSSASEPGRKLQTLLKIVLELAAHPPPPGDTRRQKPLEEKRTAFLDRFEGTERTRAFEMLDLARASYQLRDDDNIYLGRIEAELTAALEEGRRRLRRRDGQEAGIEIAPELLAVMDNLDSSAKPNSGSCSPADEDFTLKARQLVGQPAGSGIARGKARVITHAADLADFKHGEVLVCDAVDPNMTFVVPLACGIIERRGGMLIHGAIIAREYGLPCVTGVPDATAFIKTGDEITVDGFLGIVTINSGEL